MTYAIRIVAPADRNGNSRAGWIIATHSSDFEGFIMQGSLTPSNSLHRGILSLRRILSIKPDSLRIQESPYQNNVPIHVGVGEFNAMKKRARAMGMLVGF